MRIWPTFNEQILLYNSQFDLILKDLDSSSKYEHLKLLGLL